MDIRQLEAFVYTVKYQSFPSQLKSFIFRSRPFSCISTIWKRTSYTAFEANDQEFVGHARRQTLYNYAAEILNLQQKAILELSDKIRSCCTSVFPPFRPSIFCRNCFRRTIRKCRMSTSVPAARTVWMSFGK